MAKINLRKNNDEGKGKEEVEIHHGSTQDLLKARPKMADKVLRELEGLLEDYNGEGLILIRQEYDENNKSTGARVLHAGVDDVDGLISLAKACSETEDRIIKTITEHAGPETLLKLMAGQLKDMLEDLTDDKKN